MVQLIRNFTRREATKYTQRLERTEFRMPYFFFRTILLHDIGSKKKHFIEFQVTIR